MHVNFSKLRRGMVFWYDPNPEIDKNNVPAKIVDGHSIKDYTMYGDRPYVVVSSDEVCRMGRIVQVCPIGTKSKDKEDFVYDVTYNSFSNTGLSVIRCEQVRTVNSEELYKYECMLDDDVMDQVAEKLKLLLGIADTVDVVESPVISASIEEIEDLMEAKLAGTKEETAAMLDTAVSRVLNAIATTFHRNVKSDESEDQIVPKKRKILVVDPKVKKK